MKIYNLYNQLSNNYDASLVYCQDYTIKVNGWCQRNQLTETYKNNKYSLHCSTITPTTPDINRLGILLLVRCIIDARC